MKFFVAIILTALFSFVGGLYFSWWIIALAAFIAILMIPLRTGRAFFAGFLGVFILWGFLAWWIDMKNEHVLSRKIAEIFPLGGSSFAIILVTAIVGALVGGLAAMSASFLRSSK